MDITSNYLYHGTSFDGIVGIIKSNSINGWDPDGPNGASMTFSLQIAEDFCGYKSRERAGDIGRNIGEGWKDEDFYPPELHLWKLFGETGGGGGYFVFDRQNIEQKHKIVTHDATGDGSECEVRFTKKIKGFNQLVDHIVIPNQENFARYASRLLETNPEFQNAIETIVKLTKDAENDLKSLIRKPNRLRM